MNQSPPESSELKCDFCSTKPIFKSYDATPIRMDLAPGLAHVCDTRWAACSICASLIDQGQWDDLTDRSMALWRAEAKSRGIQPSARELRAIRAMTSELHRRFREARKATA
jgi:hypothetical protein